MNSTLHKFTRGQLVKFQTSDKWWLSRERKGTIFEADPHDPYVRILSDTHSLHRVRFEYVEPIVMIEWIPPDRR